ncbi:hypothetical protein BC938DRAFT_483829 [Jimgerdemannia flammicorona]|uniref:TIGR02453 family protein n=1 Tax=Jimgerdemannia flammicorona TaxID=994334 RepID=A0A433QB71_9FUNG|nr:hypothetical protein BC938DRAFT_483829 [Jimgerdemannia flammicorona]
MPLKAPPRRSARASQPNSTSAGIRKTADNANSVTNVKPNSNSVSPKKVVRASIKTAKTARPQKKRTRNKSDDETDSDPSTPEDEEEATPAKKKIKPTKSKTRSTPIPHPPESPYPDAISPDVLEFMQELAENNDREWMLVNNDRWHATKKDFTDFIALVMKELKEIDTTILNVEPKEAVFRLNRDLRFTNDLSPYKTYLSAAFSRGGKKSPFAAYYISICPGNKSYLGAGVWHPSTPILTRIRNGIDQDPTLLYQALELDEVQAFFGKKGIAVLEHEAERLKTAPKGFPKDHAEIELLKYKSFVVGKALTDEEVVGEGFLEKVVQGLEAIVPFVTVLNGWTG